MEKLNEIVSAVDGFVWGPVMLVLLVGTGIFLTIRTGFLPWRNLGYALKSTLSKEARTKSRGTGDVSPFSALTTALAATIGTGNIVGVATAMVSGGPGALVWMWISAAFGMTSKFSECMLAIKYREVNAKGEMSGGPMYTMKKAFKHKKFGAVLGWLFALFAVIASFGIGNMTQANSISESLSSTFSVPTYVTGIILTVFALLIIVGGIKTISKVSSVVVPLMAIFYVVAGLIVIIINIQNLPAGEQERHAGVFRFLDRGGDGGVFPVDEGQIVDDHVDQSQSEGIVAVALRVAEHVELRFEQRGQTAVRRVAPGKTGGQIDSRNLTLLRCRSGFERGHDPAFDFFQHSR